MGKKPKNEQSAKGFSAGRQYNPLRPDSLNSLKIPPRSMLQWWNDRQAKETKDEH